jgi:hypothetical protein
MSQSASIVGRVGTCVTSLLDVKALTYAVVTMQVGLWQLLHRNFASTVVRAH